MKKLPPKDLANLENSFANSTLPKNENKTILSIKEKELLKSILQKINNKKDMNFQIASIDKNIQNTTKPIKENFSNEHYNMSLGEIRAKTENIFEVIHQKYIEKYDFLSN